MKYHPRLLVVLFTLLVGCGSETPAPSIDTSCVRTSATEGISISCDNGDTIVYEQPSPENNPAGEQTRCIEAIPVSSPWTSDTGGSLIPPFVIGVAPNGVLWRSLFILPDDRTLSNIDVAVRPFATPPAAPIQPMALSLWRGNDLTDEWSLVAQIEDDPAKKAYGGPRFLSITGLNEANKPGAKALYQLEAQAPNTVDVDAAIVVESVPYLTLSYPCPAE